MDAKDTKEVLNRLDEIRERVAGKLLECDKLIRYLLSEAILEVRYLKRHFPYGVFINHDGDKAERIEKEALIITRAVYNGGDTFIILLVDGIWIFQIANKREECIPVWNTRQEADGEYYLKYGLQALECLIRYLKSTA